VAQVPERVRQLLVLGLLLEEGMHGYRLNETLTHVIGSGITSGRSSVYYTLETLERQGHVEHERQQKGRRPERRVFRITDPGKSFFESLLREQLGDLTSTYYLDDASTAFLDRIPEEEARRLLADKREKIQTALREFQEHPGIHGGWRHIVSRNVAHLDAELAWVDGVLGELACGPG